MRVSFDRLLSLPLLLLPALREAARRTSGLKIKLLPESSSLFPLPDNYLWQPPTSSPVLKNGEKEEVEKEIILKLLLSLHNHLAVVAGQHDCGDLQHPNRSLTMKQSSTYLQAQNQEFGPLTLEALEWIIRTDQDVGFRLLGEDPHVPVTDISEISQLESTRPRMPLTCRLRRAFLTVGSKVLLVAAGE
ncbi:hypothetical protein OJAV_G00237240 [Oryzias javanicus]|uniref:Uncharacterized protein n=1 Tax=Oryzias javanicus TaxID=123683 RepID=A0A437BY85_ORYJA|nr:hypothetical protein OJAV_G00237240 [Oryzias javanicus]